VTLGGTSGTSTSHAIQFGVPNGTYVLSVGAVANYTANYSSPIVVVGAPVQALVNFSTTTYPILVLESGLQSGAPWSVSATNSETLAVTTAASTSTSVTLHLARGSYTLSTAGPAGYHGSLSVVNLVVGGSGTTTVSVAFAATPATGVTPNGIPWFTLVAPIIIGLVAALGAGWGYRQYQQSHRREEAEGWFREFRRPPPGGDAPPPK